MLFDCLLFACSLPGLYHVVCKGRIDLIGKGNGRERRENSCKKSFDKKNFYAQNFRKFLDLLQIIDQFSNQNQLDNLSSNRAKMLYNCDCITCRTDQNFAFFLKSFSNFRYLGLIKSSPPIGHFSPGMLRIMGLTLYNEYSGIRTPISASLPPPPDILFTFHLSKP